MSNKSEFIFWSIIVVVAILIVGAVLYGGSLLDSWTYSEQEYNVVIDVQAVEHSTRRGIHTNVWAKVYGDQDITYNLQGHHEFEVGKTYRINFVNKIEFDLLAGFFVRGQVISIEVV